MKGQQRLPKSTSISRKPNNAPGSTKPKPNRSNKTKGIPRKSQEVPDDDTPFFRSRNSPGLDFSPQTLWRETKHALIITFLALPILEVVL
jgi:hypothetical protein